MDVAVMIPSKMLAQDFGVELRHARVPALCWCVANQ